MNDFNWQTKFGYYFTYFGDIYSGISVKKNPNDENFYIISKNKWNEYNNLLNNGNLKENLDNLGIHISSKKIIDHWVDMDKFSFFASKDITNPWLSDSNSYKKMYIFGAGSSANCLFGEGAIQLKNSKLRPPLGNELFNERFDEVIKMYPGVELILSRFEIEGNDIERLFEEDWNVLLNSRNTGLISQHLQILFYLQKLFVTISNHTNENSIRHNLYKVFAYKLAKNLNNRNKAIIISFNYDTLLDVAFEKQFNIEFREINSYVSHGNNEHFLFYKPHGSCNWGWEFDKNKLGLNYDKLESFLYKERLTFAKIYYNLLGEGMISNSSWGIEASNHPNFIGKYTPNKDKIKVMNSELKYLPALLLPYRDKDEFVMPYSQQIQMESLIMNVEELILIGWKGNENLFNTKLKNKIRNLSKITIVNPESKQVLDTISQFLDLSKVEIQVNNTFEEYCLNFMN